MTVLSPDQVAMALLQAQRELGVQLTREEMYGLVAIPSRESGYDTQAHNDSGIRYPRGDPRNTGDDSYSLWQINMLGAMGDNRRRALGIRSNAELFDPVVSAKAAIQLVLDGRKRGDPLYAWGGYKGKSNTYNVSPQADSMARAAVDRVGGGVAGGGESFLSNMRQSIYSGNKGVSSAATSLVSWLNAQIGKPYRAGASDPNGNAFDCSGLAAAAYAATLGIKVPALTFSMMHYGVQVATDSLQPGDLMFRHGSQGDFGHMGVYIGNGQVIAAPHTGAFVRTEDAADWISAANKQGGTVRRLVDGDGKVIVGGGLTPGMKPGTQTVPVSQAKMMADIMAPITGATDPFALKPETNVPRKIIEDRQPFVLPGLGGQLESV